MSKKLGVVKPDAPVVEPLRNQSQPSLGAIVQREVSVQPPSAPSGLGQVKNDVQTVSVEALPPVPIGQVHQIVVTAPPPPGPSAPSVGVVHDRTPQLSAAPIQENAQPIGVVRQAVKAGIQTAPAAVVVGPVKEVPTLYPPASAVQVLPATVGKVVENVVNVQVPVPSGEPEKVVSIVLAAKPVIVQPVEISPFRRDD